MTSGRPNTAPGSSIATRWWQANASSNPPPSAVPLSAATTGTLRVSNRRRSALSASVRANTASASSGPAWMSSTRSPPAKKVDFAEVRMTPVSPSSASSRRTTSARSAVKRARIVLARC